ncbi:unnamed protein product, partial [Gulo gulo]
TGVHRGPDALQPLGKLRLQRPSPGPQCRDRTRYQRHPIQLFDGGKLALAALPGRHQKSLMPSRSSSRSILHP